MSSVIGKVAPDGSSASSGFDALLTDIRARRAEFEAARHVARDIVDGLRAVGLYRAAVPRSLGGDERPLGPCLDMIERIAEADPSVGWVASFAPQGAGYFGALPLHRMREIYAAGPDVVGAGGLFPLQPVKRVEGGLLVDGRWKFASGCMAADWLSVGISIPEDGDNPPPRLLVMPADRVEIVENWETVGLAGTGSHDLVVRDAVVEEDWSFIRGGTPNLDATICRFPSVALAALTFAAVGLGAARSSLNLINDVARGKLSITGAPRLADRAYVQTGIARATVQLDAARALLHERTDSAWAKLEAGDALSIEEKAGLRLAASNASRSSIRVAEKCFSLAGTTAIFLDNPLQRNLRDALVVNQHAFLAEGCFEQAGRVMLGLAAPGFP